MAGKTDYDKPFKDLSEDEQAHAMFQVAVETSKKGKWSEAETMVKHIAPDAATAEMALYEGADRMGKEFEDAQDPGYLAWLDKNNPSKADELAAARDEDRKNRIPAKLRKQS